jgi:hypothetical protein
LPDRQAAIGPFRSLHRFEAKPFAKSTSNQFQAIGARAAAAFVPAAPFSLNRRREREFD